MTNAITPTPSADPPALGSRARAYVKASKAPNTIRAYKSCFADFCEWAQATRPTLPSDPITVADYVAHLADLRAAVSTIEQRLAAIGFIHRSAGYPDPTRDEHVVEVMSGIRRELHTRPHGKAAILRDDLIAMVKAVMTRPDERKGAELRQARDRAILLLGFAGAFRRSELCQLTVADIKLEPQAITVTLAQSKTDQEGEGIVKVIPAMSDKRLCPVRAARVWLRRAGIVEGPVFRKVDRWGHIGAKPMSGETIAQIVKGAANLAGLPYTEMAGHSLRAGFVSQASLDGMHTEEIMTVTAHKSPQMVMRYNRETARVQVRTIKKVMGDV